MMSWKDTSLCVFVWCTLLNHLSISQAGSVPVMLWSGQSSSPLVDPLHRTSMHEFQNILTERLGRAQPPILLFVKDNFCVENIKHHKENLQQLTSAGPLTYFTSVQSALTVFKNFPSFNVTMEDNLEVVADGQLAIVTITDLSAIPEIYNMIREASQNLVVALTGNSCSYTSSERTKRAVEISEPTAPLIINADNEILFYADRNPSIEVNNQVLKLKALTNSMVHRNASDYYLTMVFSSMDENKIKLQAQFNISGRYFRFVGMTFELNGETEKQVFLKSQNSIVFPFNFSYHCARANIFSYQNKNTREQVILKLTNLQVQMDSHKFGDAYDCIGFMSIPIWTGIFVTVILALIMIWGLTMIMDIRTMDRFDDPKGKTITISAQE